MAVPRVRWLSCSVLLTLLMLVVAAQSRSLPDSAAAHGGMSLGIIGVDASAYPQITVRVRVTDSSGLPATGLAASRFVLAEDAQAGHPVRAKAAIGAEQGTRVLLLIDVGPSTHGAALAAGQAAARSVLGMLGPRDDAGISLFAGALRPLLPFTSDRGRLDAALRGLAPATDQSRIFDALYSALRHPRSGAGRTAIVLITDGNDVHSRHSMLDCIIAALQSSIPVYVVAQGSSPVLKPLNTIAARTGGQLVVGPTVDHLSRVFQGYSLRYVAPVIGHRNQRVSLSVRYRTGAGHLLVAHTTYVIPSAPWIAVQPAHADLGSFADLHALPISIIVRSESNRPGRLTVAAAGLPGLRVSPASIPVPSYADGAVRRTLVVRSQARFPAGMQGNVSLTFHPSPPGLMVQAVRTFSVRVLPEEIVVSPGMLTLGTVPDFRQPRVMRFHIKARLPGAAMVRISVLGLPGGSATPSSLAVRATGRTSIPIAVRIQANPLPPQGQAGHFSLQLTAAQPGIRMPVRVIGVSFRAAPRLILVRPASLSLGTIDGFERPRSVRLTIRTQLPTPVLLSLGVDGLPGGVPHPASVLVGGAGQRITTISVEVGAPPLPAQGQAGSFALRLTATAPGVAMPVQAVQVTYRVLPRQIMVRQSSINLGTVPGFLTPRTVRVVVHAQLPGPVTLHFGIRGLPGGRVQPDSVHIGPSDGTRPITLTATISGQQLPAQGGAGVFSLLLTPRSTAFLLPDPAIRVAYRTPPRELEILSPSLDLGSIADFRRAQTILLRYRARLPEAVLLRPVLTGLPGAVVAPGLIMIQHISGREATVPLHIQASPLPAQGLGGHFVLSLQPIAGDYLMPTRQITVSYTALPRLLRIVGFPSRLGPVTDLAGGHTIYFTITSTLRYPVTLRVHATRPASAVVIPDMVRVPPTGAAPGTSEWVVLEVQHAPSGRHGSAEVAFQAPSGEVVLANGVVAATYYVPSWWESNWQRVVASAALLVLLIGLLAGLGIATKYPRLLTLHLRWRCRSRPEHPGAPS